MRHGVYKGTLKSVLLYNKSGDMVTGGSHGDQSSLKVGSAMNKYK